MRTIKFRAWSRRHEKYINPSEFVIDSTGGVFWGNVDLDKSTFEIRNWILEQYTDLKDKNGNEIYEGDILRDKGNKSWVCIFEKYRNGWAITEMNKYGGYGYYIENATTQKVRERQLIIVGNIYEGVKDSD